MFPRSNISVARHWSGTEDTVDDINPALPIKVMQDFYHQPKILRKLLGLGQLLPWNHFISKVSRTRLEMSTAVYDGVQKFVIVVIIYNGSSPIH